MCFSAQASLIASATLLALGSYAIKKIKSKASSKNLLPLALVPFFFGIQQTSEGFIWLTYANPDMAFITQAATWFFLFFAFFFWPVWIPFTALMFEKSAQRKSWFLILLGAGITIASTLIFIALESGVTPEVSCSHIRYNVHMPDLFNYWGPFVYCMTTVMPFFISTRKRMWLFGLALSASVLITYIFYAEFFTSVWCFFSAILSMGIIALI